MAIYSNPSIAGDISASFSQFASALNSIGVSVSASSTNVSASDNINSVAKEFERIDQNIAQLTKFNLPGGLS